MAGPQSNNIGNSNPMQMVDQGSGMIPNGAPQPPTTMPPGMAMNAPPPPHQMQNMSQPNQMPLNRPNTMQNRSME